MPTLSTLILIYSKYPWQTLTLDTVVTGIVWRYGWLGSDGDTFLSVIERARQAASMVNEDAIWGHQWGGAGGDRGRRGGGGGGWWRCNDIITVLHVLSIIHLLVVIIWCQLVVINRAVGTSKRTFVCFLTWFKINKTTSLSTSTSLLATRQHYAIGLMINK